MPVARKATNPIGVMAITARRIATTPIHFGIAPVRSAERPVASRKT